MTRYIHNILVILGHVLLLFHSFGMWRYVWKHSIFIWATLGSCFGGPGLIFFIPRLAPAQRQCWDLFLSTLGLRFSRLPAIWGQHIGFNCQLSRWVSSSSHAQLDGKTIHFNVPMISGKNCPKREEPKTRESIRPRCVESPGGHAIQSHRWLGGQTGAGDDGHGPGWVGDLDTLPEPLKMGGTPGSQEISQLGFPAFLGANWLLVLGSVYSKKSTPSRKRILFPHQTGKAAGNSSSAEREKDIGMICDRSQEVILKPDLLYTMFSPIQGVKVPKA